MQEDTYETPLKTYLYDGEYFLWIGKRERTEISYRFPFKAFLLIFLSISFIIAIVSFIWGKFSFEGLLEYLAVISVAAIMIFAVRTVFKTDDEYYAVTNIRVMRLKGKNFVFENLNNVSEVKIYPIDDYYYGRYAGINIQLRAGRINSFGWDMKQRGDKHFFLEKSEAEYVKNLIISQRDKLNNK